MHVFLTFKKYKVRTKPRIYGIKNGFLKADDIGEFSTFPKVIGGWFFLGVLNEFLRFYWKSYIIMVFRMAHFNVLF